MEPLENENKQDKIPLVNCIIEKAIKEDAVMEILYINNQGINKLFHIRSLKFSPKFGNDYIVAYCDEAYKELTFKISYIKRANIVWNNIPDKNTQVPESGIYLLACRGDMHLIYELYYYTKGSLFYERFIKENEHYNNYAWIYPIAYHFIPLYSPEDKINWTQFSLQDNSLADGIYVFAYKKLDLSDGGCFDNSFTLPSTYNYLNDSINGVYYSLIRPTELHDNLMIKEHCNILGYHFCMLP